MTGRLAQLWRYPVKSMLGERLGAAEVTATGVAGDRGLALVHRETGRVASAKHPRHWRGLLTLRAAGAAPGPVRITLPDGRIVSSVDGDVDEILSRVLGAPVTLTGTPPDGAVLDRARPEAVLDAGVTADVPVDLSPLGTAAPGTFFDFAPIHLVTTATLRRLAAGGSGAAHAPGSAGPLGDTIGAPERGDGPGGGFEPVRYRPNLVIDVAADGFVENDWVGRELRIGDALVLRVLAATPRCAVPTLAHGELPRAVAALRAPARLNRIAPLPQLDPQPCVGAYAQVVRAGRVTQGAPVEVG
ncbi:MOSC N-terminal beta barrel domain-containing protein [Micromonospora sp. C28SCA-DRY-2]|uniref:MOSC domain-containing protein n=1 Tax=Micromonospora sp. C28SCA-DRY-2 TaxID=3059522 RepID=UPI0026763983|nr:MOSC N-terminal beta barrel domain-containing protein [Micromonospora sp. C28SCA-DRY-2]MDO3704435.1 MOSC N-terminal beta barrel domain-containing protein [Micromonospora sp. C28SCA-DRY-2]